MFFYAAKVLWFMLQPSCLLVFLLLVGTVMVWTSYARWGRRLVAFSALLLLIAGLSPLGNLLVMPLEDRFQRTDLSVPPPPTGLILLGGAEDKLVQAERKVPSLNAAGERFTETVTLARRFPKAWIVFSGGDAGVLYHVGVESVWAARILEGMGVAKDRILLESRSRDTYENALYTKALLAKDGLLGPDKRWVLVTSAYQMPRAMGCFRKVGLDVEPWPVDYRTGGPKDDTRPFMSVADGLQQTDLAAKEWVGLLAYWLDGRTSALFPGPQPRPAPNADGVAETQ
jgi:uncharacterized SAM-binding protein YcdF (DUF218 family)